MTPRPEPEKPPFGIDAEAINRYLAEQIAESLLGEKVREAIDSVIVELTKGHGTYGSDSAIKTIVKTEAHKLLREYLETEPVQTVLRAAIEKQFDATRIAQLAEAMEIRIGDRF